MTPLLCGLALLLAGGVLSLLVSARPAWATAAGLCGALAGCGLALVSVVAVLAGRSVEPVAWNWHVPYGSLSLGLDPLSAWFALVIALVPLAAALYGAEYLWAYRGQKWLGPPWFFYNLLVASMLVVVLAQNGVLFLVAWELMALAGFFLVSLDDSRVEVRRAGRVFLIASHLGTAFLLAFFVLLARHAGSFDFARLAAAGPLPASTADWLLALALVGFGTKAGFVPLHVWLPEAHPAAPSHVSAVMSGAMIKTGIYGLLRSIGWLSEASPWWAWVLIGVGLVSGLLGAVFALVQPSLKRLLAYSSVENMGVIALGIGIGWLGVTRDAPLVAVAGFSSALLHVLNHGLFKGLLFLGAGSVLHACGHVRIDRLGGLLRRMPWTGTTFLVGVAAISALPPLAGFFGEFLIFVGALRIAVTSSSAAALPALLVLAGLALVGGVTLAAFSKAGGLTFLGEPRSSEAAAAHEGGWPMRAALVALAAGCLLAALAAPGLLLRLEGVLVELLKLPAEQIHQEVVWASGLLGTVLRACWLLMSAMGLLLAVRAWLLAGRSVERGPTWDCGYAQPTARMQYSGLSYVQPLVRLLRPLVPLDERLIRPTGLFPQAARLSTRVDDPVLERGYVLLFRGLLATLARTRWLQRGHVQLYVLYIALTLLTLLIWYLGSAR